MTRKTRPHKPFGPFSRRVFLRKSALAASALSITPAMRVWGNEGADSESRLLVTLQLDGGVDVTMLCDPKVNVSGEPKINHWADSLDPQQAGEITYAPVANNDLLFERFGQDMLVVNGVDSQTNSHDTGQLFNWTGVSNEGKPSLTALFAAAQAPEQPLSYSVFGGLSRTAGVIGYNRFDDLSVLRSLAQPDIEPWSGESKRWASQIARAQQSVDAESARLMEMGRLSVRQRLSVGGFSEARLQRDTLDKLADLIPDEEDIVQREDFNAGGEMFSSNLKQQMQSALLVFQSGLGVSADLELGGFDSHEENEPIQEALLAHFYEALSYFWDTAESLNLAHRILLVIGSDFGRTNFINEGNGKDHWPIGSYIIMEQGAPWGNRVVGVTDELHFARPLNPETLLEDPNGMLLTPTHIHHALRQYLQIDVAAESLGHGLSGIPSVPLFELT